MKYTAVQILISELKNYLPSIHQKGLIDKCEQALQLEKQQIIDAVANPFLGSRPECDAKQIGENYYKTTFNK